MVNKKMKKTSYHVWRAHVFPLFLIGISVLFSRLIIPAWTSLLARTLSPDGIVNPGTAINAYLAIIANIVLIYYMLFVDMKKSAKFHIILTFSYVIISELIIGLDRKPIQSEQHYIGYITAVFLITAGIVCLYNLTKTKKTVWAFMGVGFIGVAIDELAAFHEYLGSALVEPIFKKIGGLSVMNILDHPDDWIILLYLVIGIVFVYVYWNELITLEHNVKLRNFILLGLFFQLTGVFGEANRFWIVEEVGELWASLSYLIASSSVFLLRKIEWWRRMT